MKYDRWVEALTDLAPFELDVAGNVSEWESAAQRLLGHPPAEMIGRKFAPFADESAPVEALLDTAARQGRSEIFGRAVRKDGTRFWANQLLMPIFDSAQQIIGYAGVLRDVTSWKEAEEERDRIFALSADLIGIAGFDGFFKRVSPSFARVLGYPQSAILGKPFIHFVHPDDVAATQAESSSLAIGKETKAFRNRYRCADGSYRWLEWNTRSLVADKLLFAIARDVTEQKLIDEKLQAYSRELERSNVELQQFAYVASHDLQEPLRAVAGCMQVFAERNVGTIDDKSRELMGYAVDGAKRMQTLINDLLEYSRLGSKGISKALIDPRLAIDKAVRQLNTAISESGALLSIDPLPRVFADAFQLAQLFQNLIGNSIKFRADRPPEIHVSAEQGTGQTTFCVRDNGIGIPPEYSEKVFGIFQRLHSRREYTGTGIGLAICKKIVERHEGRIWIEPNTGGGAIFRFTIPDEKKR